MSTITSKQVVEQYGTGALKALREAVDLGLIEGYDPKTGRKLHVLGTHRSVVFPGYVEAALKHARGYLEVTAALHGLIPIRVYAQREGIAESMAYARIRRGELPIYNHLGVPLEINGKHSRVFVHGGEWSSGDAAVDEPRKTRIGQWLTGALKWNRRRS